MIILDTEKTDLGAVYWVSGDHQSKEFGVVFPNGYFNIANQGVVESIILSLGTFGDALDELENN